LTDAAAWWGPDPPEHRPLGDPGRKLPLPQRRHRTELRSAIGDRHGHGPSAAAALALGVGPGQTQAAVARLEVLDPDGGEFGAARCPGEAAISIGLE
jgi:hypothetical protein